MFKWRLSQDGKYLYAVHNPTIRTDLQGNVYGGGTVGAIIGSTVLSVGAGAYQAHQAGKAAESQQEAWEQMSEPQKEYMRQMYPMQLEMMESYVPYYKDVLATQKELLPYSTEALTEQYYPMYGKTYEDILAYGAEGVQPWEREAVGVPFTEARTKLGERAAGAGVLRAGPTQKLATLYDIAESQALMQLPYARKQQALQQQMQFLGYTPTTPSVSAPGQIGVSVPSMPPAQQAEGMDWSSIGKLLGMGLSFGGQTPTVPGQITGGVGGVSTGYQMTPYGYAPTWSPYS